MDGISTLLDIVVNGDRKHQRRETDVTQVLKQCSHYYLRSPFVLVLDSSGLSAVSESGDLIVGERLPFSLPVGLVYISAQSRATGLSPLLGEVCPLVLNKVIIPIHCLNLNVARDRV